MWGWASLPSAASFLAGIVLPKLTTAFEAGPDRLAWVLANSNLGAGSLLAACGDETSGFFPAPPSSPGASAGMTFCGAAGNCTEVLGAAWETGAADRKSTRL